MLERVSHGETLEVTNRGRVVARISPAETDVFSTLVAQGLLIPPTNTAPIPLPVGPVDTTSAATAALLAMREEEAHR